MKTLLIDGDNLFNLGFYGVREFFVDGNHIGGLFHFINTIRKQLDEHDYDKVFVVWDGEHNSQRRRELYPDYKLNRKERLNEFQKESFNIQRNKVQNYLEEFFIRQLRVSYNEGDDLISHYCLTATNENITVFSSDKDLLQLLSSQVTVYSPLHKRYFYEGDKVKLDTIEVPHVNLLVAKILLGDKSDNVFGVINFGEKTLVKFFPEVLEVPTSIDDILSKAGQIYSKKKSKALENLLRGTCKKQTSGKDYFITRKLIMDLQNPMITDEAKDLVEEHIRENIDPEGRSYKNVIRMMTQDGFFKYIPKSDEGFVEFIRPFMKLTRKEKRKFNKEQTN